MSKSRKSLLAIAVLLVAIIAAACSGSIPARDRSSPASAPASSIKPVSGAIQSNEAGGVAIEVQWVKAEGNALIFRVDMNTHSVELDRYDLKKLAVLRDDAGNEYRPVAWDSAPGGHHRSGTLAFPLPDSLSQGKTKFIEMVIQDVAGIKQRVLKWEL